MASYLTPKQEELVLMIEKEVAKYFDLDGKEYHMIMRGARRDQRCAHARQFQWYIMHEILGLPLKLIGKTYGKDHTTVMSGIASLRSRSTYKEYKQKIREIMELAAIKKLRKELAP